MAEKLTQKKVADAIASGRRADHADLLTPGLQLRVWGPGRWAWAYRRAIARRDYRLDLGSDWCLDEAREIAHEAARRVRHGPCPIPGFAGEHAWAQYMADRRARRDGREPEPLPVPPPPRPESLPWDDALAEWMAEVERVRRKSTAAGYRNALRVAELRPWGDRHVSEFRIEDAAEAVRAIARRGAERQAELTCTALRQFFGWLGSDDQRRRSGVEKGRMSDLEPPERTLDETGKDHTLHIPSAREVGTIVRWLRSTKSAPERDRLAGLLLVYTAQRRSAVAAARKEDFEPAGEHGGLWVIPPLHRKTASMKSRLGHKVGAHIIPLPMSAWAIVRQAIEASEGDYLFMPERDRRANKPSLHMPADRLTHMWREIPGLASPHDMRRAFGTSYAEEADLADSDVKSILDHSEGVPHGDVTAEHYRLKRGQHRKWSVMRGYVDWVDKCAITHVRIPRQAVEKPPTAQRPAPPVPGRLRALRVTEAE